MFLLKIMCIVGVCERCDNVFIMVGMLFIVLIVMLYNGIGLVGILFIDFVVLEDVFNVSMIVVSNKCICFIVILLCLCLFRCILCW